MIKALRGQASWNTGPLRPDGTNEDCAVLTLKPGPGGYRITVSGTGELSASPGGWGKELQSMSSGWTVKIKELEIGEGITAIDMGVFSACRYLDRVSLPASLETIGPLAFASCGRLKHISYAGTISQWKALEARSPGWSDESSIQTVLCSDGEIAGKQ